MNNLTNYSIIKLLENNIVSKATFLNLGIKETTPNIKG